MYRPGDKTDPLIAVEVSTHFIANVAKPLSTKDQR